MKCQLSCGRGRPATGRGGVPSVAILLSILLLLVPMLSRAALQFDVFLGYDNVVPEATWFPVVCEIKNDGPPFNGTIEITAANINQGQTRQAVVELPTGTLKRITVPVFSTTRGYSSWDVRLLDERGKVRAEQTQLRARKQPAAGIPVLGALSRTPSGTPLLLATKQQSENQPPSARLLPAIFPDNPLVLEGMTSLYLSSEKAADLHVPNQVDALYAWIYAGGHLIVGVEQIADINSTPWLKGLFPVEIADFKSLDQHAEFQKFTEHYSSWATNVPTPGRNRVYNNQNRPRGSRQAQPPPPVAESDETNPLRLEVDLNFETTAMQVAVGHVREGQMLLAHDDMPLIVSARRGQGRVTALLFSPEREPFKSWKNAPAFWAGLCGVPSTWYTSADYNYQGGMSSDGIFGAMIDTRQVHKLPVEWLLLLLIVYLIVIGPLDQYWLKKIGRPMLTWITFPCYVVAFSLLIYFIGYKLRAGESEWNELHIVDVLASGDHAELRGRTYSSVYAPANAKYQIESHQKYATFRGEFLSYYMGGQSTEKATVLQKGDSFKAEIFVPVWTSQLFVSDWWQPAPIPVTVSINAPSKDNYQVKIENQSGQKLTDARLVIGSQLFTIGDVAPNETMTKTINASEGTTLRDFVWEKGQQFAGAVQGRQHAFGGRESGQISNLPDSTIAASFLSQLGRNDQYGMGGFIAPPGLDLTPVVERGNAVLFAWAEGYSPIKPMHQFSPKLAHKNTMFRVAAAIQ
jgi:hypothetical protein